MTRPKKKCWSHSVGEYGSKVRVAELKPGGTLYLLWVGSGRKQHKRSLGIRDQSQAKQQARQLAASLASYDKESQAARLPIGMLFDNFMENGLAGRSSQYRKEVKRKLSLWTTFLGADRAVESLSPSDVYKFVAARKDGKLCPLNSNHRRPVGQTTVWHDVVALKTAINFALRQRNVRGKPLLAADPLIGVRVSRTVSPAQPVADRDRYQALKSVAEDVGPMFELALDLAFSTGHRIGAILRLRWADVSFDASQNCPFGSIRWRAENDKMRNEHSIPLSQDAKETLQRAARGDPRIGDSWIFPATFDASKPVDRHLASRWLKKAERLAGIAHVRADAWHAFRRGWASARKGMPDVDVAAAGGWKDTATMKRSYQKVDARTLLRVVMMDSCPTPEADVSTELSQCTNVEKLRSA